MPTCPSSIAVATCAARRSLSRFERRIPLEIRQELCQETLVRVWLATELADPGGYAWRVAAHLAVDHLRRARPTTTAVEVPGADWPGAVEDRMDAASVVRLMRREAPSQVEVLVHLFLADRDVDDLVGGGSRTLGRDRIYKRRSRALDAARALLPELARRAA